MENNWLTIEERESKVVLTKCAKEAEGEIVIPDNVTVIGESAFDGCEGLKSINIPDSVTSIGDWAFIYCEGLTLVKIPNSVTAIGEGAFYGCDGLSGVTIPISVTCIGFGAFSGCDKLTSIRVESGNPRYDSRDNCNAIIETATNTLIQGCLKTIIPDSVSSIGDSAFMSFRGMTGVNIPNRITSIGDSSFSGCSDLTSVIIPDGVTSIGERAFQSCYNLESVRIPDSVSSLGKGVFEMCDKLSSVKVGMRKPIPIDSDAFTNRSNATLYVPKGSKKAYKRAKFWEEFKEIIEYKVYSHRS